VACPIGSFDTAQPVVPAAVLSLSFISGVFIAASQQLAFCCTSLLYSLRDTCSGIRKSSG
jgi:hypothetical protein